MRDDPVLVITSVEDVTADMVVSALTQRGVPVVRVDTADIGDGLSFSCRLGTGAGISTGHGRLATASRVLDLARVRSVYHRRPGPWRFDHLPRQAREFATMEARYGLNGVLAGLPVLHINDPFANARAEYKPVQLATAAAVGLPVPATLITNDPAAVTLFEDEHGPLIYKPFRGVPPGEGMSGVIWAQRITAAEVDDSLAVTAHLFQAEVAPKAAEVRVIVVGSRVFAWRVIAPGDLLDWRSEDWNDLTYEPVDLPDEIVKGLNAYLLRLRLVFGAFDLVVDTAGTVWFIEFTDRPVARQGRSTETSRAA